MHMRHNARTLTEGSVCDDTRLQDGGPMATYGNGRGFVHNDHILVHVYDGNWMTGDGYLVPETGSTLPDTVLTVYHPVEVWRVRVNTALHRGWCNAGFGTSLSGVLSCLWVMVQCNNYFVMV